MLLYVLFISSFYKVRNANTSQIIPLLSQASHPLPNLSSEDLAKLVNRIQFGGDEVVKAKDGAGSATLSMAYAGAEFAAKVLRAIKGEKGIVAPSYVNLAADVEGGKVLTGELGRELEYFSAPVELGPEGIVSIRPLGKTTDGEKELIKAALDELAGNIEKVCLFRREKLISD